MKMSRRGVGHMNELLMILGFLVIWLALQMWILPRFGIQT